jgi:hypothetical protein
MFDSASTPLTNTPATSKASSNATKAKQKIKVISLFSGQMTSMRPLAAHTRAILASMFITVIFGS